MFESRLAPSISVVIPFHNGSAHFVEALNSVLEQTTPPEHLFVIDNGSCPQESRWLARRVAFLEGVSLVSSAVVGQSAARNLGARLSKSDYVAFLDQDDVFEPEKLEAISVMLMQNPSIDILGHQYLRTNAGGRVWSSVKIRIPKIYSFALRNLRWIPSVLTVKVSFFNDRLRGFRDELMGFEDEDLMLRALSLGATITVSGHRLSRWRLGHKSASTSTAMQRSRVLFAEIVSRKLAELPLSGIWLVASLGKFVVGHFRGILGLLRYRETLTEPFDAEESVRQLRRIIESHKLHPLIGEILQRMGVVVLRALVASKRS